MTSHKPFSKINFCWNIGSTSKKSERIIKKTERNGLLKGQFHGKCNWQQERFDENQSWASIIKNLLDQSAMSVPAWPPSWADQSTMPDTGPHFKQCRMLTLILKTIIRQVRFLTIPLSLVSITKCFMNNTWTDLHVNQEQLRIKMPKDEAKKVAWCQRTVQQLKF